MKVDLYVDGSFSSLNPTIARGGSVIVINNEVKFIRDLEVSLKSFVSARNAGGEVLACYMGLLNVLHKYYEEDINLIVNIYYDYVGVRNFVTGEWIAKTDGMKIYANKVRELKNKHSNLKLNWFKVKAHSGNKFNELADKVAKGCIPIEYKRYLEETMRVG